MEIKIEGKPSNEILYILALDHARKEFSLSKEADQYMLSTTGKTIDTRAKEIFSKLMELKDAK